MSSLHFNARRRCRLSACVAVLLGVMLTGSSASASSDRPWRTQYPSQRSRTAHPRTYMTPNYSEHFLSLAEVKEDPRARTYAVNLKSRRPGRLSLTSQLAFANIMTYGLQVYKPSVTQWGVKLSDKILRGEQLYRLLTPVFLHGGLGHLFTNLYSLNRVGPEMEHIFGPGRFLATYLVSGITGNLLSAYKSPNPALGASGAVFGIFGAYYIFLNRHDWLLGDAGQRMSGTLAQTLGINVILGLANPMIDNWGHLGGAIGGAAMAYYFGPRVYLTELPDAGRIMVDCPVLRLPRAVESIPEQCLGVAQRVSQLLHLPSMAARKPQAPWQQPSPDVTRSNRPVPNRSIKPQKF